MSDDEARESPDPTGAADGGGARSGEGDVGEAAHATAGKTPVEAAMAADGVVDGVRAWVDNLTPQERLVGTGVGGFLAILALATLTGFINLTYLLFLLSLGGMYLLLSMGLNVQWGYTGLINFSVAAFFGLGAYGTALLTSTDSPVVEWLDGALGLAGGLPTVVGLLIGLVLAAILAVVIGIPTLSLREDYLAIASLGLAEVVRMIVLNEAEVTGGSAGLSGIPRFFENWPVLGDVARGLPTAALNLLLVVVFIAATYLFLRRIHRAPWGRAQRTIRADQDLAEALGKDTYRFKMESFVIGSVIMALAGVFYAHLFLYLAPTQLAPTLTFYIWVAVILGGTGSDAGAMFGGLVIIAIREGTRFFGDTLPVPTGSLRLLLIGAIIILIIRVRPEGLLPPQRELIFPGAGGESDD